MITVAEADSILHSHLQNFGVEKSSINLATGRVLAEDLIADRDLPPYDRVTMDGIAIKFEAFQRGIRSYSIRGTQAAGEAPIEVTADDECIEIMTGAALPQLLDTVIRYEDVAIKNGIATINTSDVTPGQSLHRRGIDKQKGDIIVAAGKTITPAIIGIAASIGKEELSVKKLPRVVIITTGDELVKISELPSPFQIRRSNNYTIHSVLQRYHVNADMVHLPDDADLTLQEIDRCITQYDVILLSGGVSMGKFDYVPLALEKLSIKKYFHKVQQRPGKPFWFGGRNNLTVFAFPGNPVSAFMCLQRYFVPWLLASLGLTAQPETYAALTEDVTFDVPLQYFLQVKLYNHPSGRLLATPIEGQGSGDFSNLAIADAFLELPLEKEIFKKDEAYRAFPFG